MTPPAPGRSLLDRLTGATILRAPVFILGWLLILLGLNVLVPQLEEVVADDSTPFVPETAPSLRAVNEMDQVFGNGKSRSFVTVVAEREAGLTAADRRYVVDLADRLGEDTENVSYVQDLSEPRLRRTLVSADGQAMYFQIGLPGYTGAPTSVGQVEGIRTDAEIGKPAGLRVLVTGASATVTDMVVEVEDSILVITAVTVALIGLILFLIYRSIAVTALVLSIIGVALGSARGAVSLLGWKDVIDVSTFSGSFLTAVVLGATTDYAIFLVSRFQELRRQGVPARDAARIGSARVAAVIIGSAGTVILANACLGLAQVGLFRTTGPPIAVSVLLSLGVSLTLTPPLLALLGARGWLDPRPARNRGGWKRMGALVIRRPGAVFAASMLPLIALAALFPFLEPSYDERSVQPEDTESSIGYDVMDAHYPRNESLPDFVLISADRDLRNPGDLAALERASRDAAALPGVGSVRGVTRPTGSPIRAASLGRQAGIIGGELDKARRQIAAEDPGRLVDGADQLDDGAGELADGAREAADGAGQLVDGVRDLHAGLERLADGSGAAKSGTADLREGAEALADGLEAAVSQTRVAVDGLGLAHDALSKSLTCSLDPRCKAAREGILQIYEGERDQLLPGLAEAAAGARDLAEGAVDLQTGLGRIRAGLADAEDGATQLVRAQRDLSDGLGQLADGSAELAEATGQVAGGTEVLAGSVRDLGDGLAEAARYLKGAGSASVDSGFYLPPSAMDDARFALASGAYLSADGQVARLIVLGETNAFGKAAARRSAEIEDAVAASLADSGVDAEVAVTGMAATNADIADLSQADFRLVAVAALIAVFLILLVLIRSLVAAAFLLGSVVLSYAATMGIAILVWQIIIGTPLEWTVACVAFVILVAVGADYNLLLIKRVHEESPDGSRAGIARAVELTGGVITAAGVIFAASMFALMAGSVTTLVQLGFTAGVGLLVDTFIVRTMVVPAFAALVGPKLWWPSRVDGGSAEPAS